MILRLATFLAFFLFTQKTYAYTSSVDLFFQRAQQSQSQEIDSFWYELLEQVSIDQCQEEIKNFAKGVGGYFASGPDRKYWPLRFYGIPVKVLSSGEVSRRNRLVFHKRADLVQHFFVSMALSAARSEKMAYEFAKLKEYKDVSSSGFDFSDLAYSWLGARFISLTDRNCSKLLHSVLSTPLTSIVSLELDRFTRLSRGQRPSKAQMDAFEERMREILNDWENLIF